MLRLGNSRLAHILLWFSQLSINRVQPRARAGRTAHPRTVAPRTPAPLPPAARTIDRAARVGF